MCGRTTLTTSADDLREFFDLEQQPELPPRYNIAPTQAIAVIREPHRLELLRWGLVLPGGRRHGAQGINARVETVARAPAYRESFRKRRCLVVVDGYFEWKKLEKARQPFLIRREDRKPLALAGIWEHTVTDDGEVVDCCAIITGGASGVVAPLHDRMPLVVPREGYDRWLSQDARTDELIRLIAPDASALVAYPVSTAVNSPANDDARCLEPAADRQPEGSLSLFDPPHRG
jgi:putative SOS response-associated peptidase YedK